MPCHVTGSRLVSRRRLPCSAGGASGPSKAPAHTSWSASTSHGRSCPWSRSCPAFLPALWFHEKSQRSVRAISSRGPACPLAV
eukprot:scaffold110304_cov27-Phaeocystis_antarctica.AAC.1